MNLEPLDLGAHLPEGWIIFQSHLEGGNGGTNIVDDCERERDVHVVNEEENTRARLAAAPSFAFKRRGKRVHAAKVRRF